MLDDYIKYYTTNILSIRKKRIDIRELEASSDCAMSQEKNVMEENIIINLDHIRIDDMNK